jgi:2-polyprenyl-6-hydroxyphenyl methylase/3-demethylubiquinone-9 3-methyltransferase
VAVPFAENAVSGTVESAEVARFAAMAAEWWDPHGPCRPLHRVNPTRLGFVRDRLAGQFGRITTGRQPFAGLGLLDIGCGGGLVSEPMARLGFAVTGIDPAAENVAVARAHARAQGLAINYRAEAAEALVAEGAQFDAVLALEVVEHVVRPAEFLGMVGRLVRPGGAIVLSTLNRTAKAWALGIVGAEYVLRWIPRGTHSWAKFVRPSELAAGVRRAGLDVREVAGMHYDPWADRWSLGPGLDVNYLMFATRA